MPTLSEKLDSVIININTLSQLQVNDRPVFSSRIVTIRQYGPYWAYINSIIRTLAGESRVDVIEGFNDLFIDTEKIFTEYIEHLQFYSPPSSVNSRTIAEQYVNQFLRLKLAIPKLYIIDGKGLNAMIDTYADAPEIVSQLSVILDHFKRFCKGLETRIDDIIELYNIPKSNIETLSIK